MAVAEARVGLQLFLTIGRGRTPASGRQWSLLRRPAASSQRTSGDAVRTKLEEAILYIERNPKTVKSITSFPYIVKSLVDVRSAQQSAAHLGPSG